MDEVYKNIKEKARLLRSEGFNVIPLFPPTFANKSKAGKSPMVERWQSEKLTDEVFDRFFGDLSTIDCNIGIPCGLINNLVVLDIDSRSGGLRWYYENKHLLEDSGGIEEQTSGGGFHIYFKYPISKNVVINKTRIAPGVEVFGQGGQVATSPSLHTSGELYHFTGNLGLEHLRDEGEELPDWIIQQITRSQSVPEENHATPILEHCDSPIDIETAERLLSEVIPPAIEGQGGDLQTLRACMVGRDYNLSPKVIWKLLIEKYNPRCKPAWELPELMQKLKNSYRYGRLPQGAKTIASEFSCINKEITAEINEAIEGEKKTSKKKGEEAYTDEEMTQKWRHSFDFKNRTACAKRFKLKMFEKFIYHQLEETFYVYSDEYHCWSPLSTDQVKIFINRTICQEQGLANIKDSHIQNIISALKDFIGVANLRPGKWMVLQAEEPNKLDEAVNVQSQEWIAVSNGLLNLASRELREHSSRYFTTWCLPFDYHQSIEQSETFNKVLSDIWGDDEKANQCKRQLQLWFGYSLSSRNDQQRCALFYGVAGAGKSTLANVLRELLGEDYVLNTQLYHFGSRFGLMGAANASHIIISEADKAKSQEVEMAIQHVKMITGNDPITVDRKFDAPLKITLQAKITMVSNDIPAFMDAEGGFLRRALIFPFDKPIAEKDLSMPSKLREEMPGILQWALEGYKALYVEGEKITNPLLAEEHREDLKRATQPLIGFVEDCLEILSPEEAEKVGGENILDILECGFGVTNENVYKCYLFWAKENGHQTFSKVNFFRKVRKILPITSKMLNVKISGRNQKVILGVKMVDFGLNFTKNATETMF